MKKLTKAFLIVGVINLIVVLGGIGWIFGTGRVDKQRTLEVVDLFSETTVQRDSRIKTEEAAVAAEIAAQEKELPSLALNSDELNNIRLEMTQIDRARLERMQREIFDLQNTLKRDRARLGSERAEFEAERNAFMEMRAQLNTIEGADQFTKSLSVLANMKPKDAKEMLNVLIEQNKRVQVISYLSAMSTSVRTDVMSEFVKAGDARLAAELLESLRLRGQETAQTDANLNDTTANALNP